MTEEPCQCSDCQRFYKEHDRFIREFPTFKQQQELSWTSIQSYRTLCSKVIDELQRELSDMQSNEDLVEENNHISENEISCALEELENVNAYLFSIEALMERILIQKSQTILNQNLKKLQMN